MAEESYMSGESTDEQPPVPVAVVGGEEAEMITKQLANCWIIIGSIPMVLFLLVAIPTIFFVKSVSEYKNAYYCDTVSCDNLATQIEKARGSETKACDNFELHICPHVKDLEMDVYKYAAKAVMKGDVETLQGIQKAVKIAFGICKETQGAAAAFIALEKVFGFKGLAGPRWNMTPGEAAGHASKWGVDSLVRCLLAPVTPPVNTSYATTAAIVQIGAPIVDRYVDLLADYAEQPKDPGHIYTTLWKNPVEELASPLADTILRDPLYFSKIDKFHLAFQEFVASTTMTVRGNMPEISTIDQLNVLNTRTWNWRTFMQTVVPTLQRDTKIRIAHPIFIYGLADFIRNMSVSLHPTDDYPNPASIKVALDTLLHIYGVPLLNDPKINAAKKSALCIVHVDRLFPMGLAALMKKDLEAKFKKPDGVISDAKSSIYFMPLMKLVEICRREVYKDLSIDSTNLLFSSYALVLTYGMKQAKAITDELIKAHALAVKSTESSRSGFYKKLSTMKYTIFYTNKSEDLDDTVLKNIVDYGTIGPDPITYEALIANIRKRYWVKYWGASVDVDKRKFLTFRDSKATTAIQSMYDLYLNRLYVSLGAFIAPMHKNSRHNKMLSARYAYYIIKGILSTFTLHGSMVGPYEMLSDPWMGYIFSSRLEAYGSCLAKDRRTNGTLNAVHDPVDVAAVIPAFRYYRKLLLERAYPRPEYRIDNQPQLNLVQLFFYVWAQPLCSRRSRKDLINSVARNNYYFDAGFECQTGKKATPCDIWNTTRRAY